jgi:RNase P subunit RPR2
MEKQNDPKYCSVCKSLLWPIKGYGITLHEVKSTFFPLCRRCFSDVRNYLNERKDHFKL